MIIREFASRSHRAQRSQDMFTALGGSQYYLTVLLCSQILCVTCWTALVKERAPLVEGLILDVATRYMLSVADPVE